MKKVNAFLLFFCVPFLLDRITKFFALYYNFDNFDFGPFIRFNLEFNRGISWSLFHSEDLATYCILSAVIFCIIIFLLWYSYNRFKLNFPIYGEFLILSGAISNFIDRLLYCGVVDFIVFHFRDFSLPTMNIADVSISVGVLILIVMILKNE